MNNKQAMYTFTMPSGRTYPVTEEEINACTRFIDGQTNEVFYKVQSASDAGVEYTVRYNRERRRLTCTCAACALRGYPTCWHRRAVLLSEKLFKEAKQAEKLAAARREQEEIEATQEYQREQAMANIARIASDLKGMLSTPAVEGVDPAYLEALKADGSEAALAEYRALKKHGLKAYESKPFTLLKEE